MAKLGEFIGALLSDAAQARVRADYEAIKIAEAYSAHELLRHLPVPRFRLPDISVEFPVLVSKLTAAPAGERGLDTPSTDEVSKVVKGALAESGIKANPAQRDKIVTAVAHRSKQLFEDEARRLLGASRVAGDLAATLVTATRNALDGDTEADDTKLRELGSKARGSLLALLVQKLTASPTIDVVTTSAEIKSHGDSGSLVRVRLTITEDAYDVVSRDEGEGFLLTPE